MENIDGLKDFYQKGYIKVRDINHDSFEMPHKVDWLIYNLTKKRITKKKIEKLIYEFETNGFKRVLSMIIRSLLSADLALYDK